MPYWTTKYALASANYATLSTTSIISTPVEDAEFPQSNLLIDDRYVVWKCPGESAVTVDLNLGSLRTVGVVGVLGCHRSGSFPNSTTWYASTDNANWSLLTNILALGIDSVFAVTHMSVRYVRCIFNNAQYSSGAFTVGKLFVASTLNDFGVVYGIGSTESTVMQRSRVRLLDGHEVVTKYGENRKRFTMLFPAADSARRTELLTLATELKPFVLVASDRTFYECRAVADVVESEARFGVVGTPDSDLWNCTLEIESLP